jgi:hypothetical protein
MWEKELISIIPEEPNLRKNWIIKIKTNFSLAINTAFNFHVLIHYWLMLIQIGPKPKLHNFLYDQTINIVAGAESWEIASPGLRKRLVISGWFEQPLGWLHMPRSYENLLLTSRLLTCI